MITIRETFVPFAHSLADAAAASIMPYYRGALEIETKADLSPVTVADRCSELLMREMIAERFPDHGIIGEEFGRERDQEEFVWVLDPIDGTKTFVAGVPLFGTLIALLQGGIPVLGIIDHPALGLRMTGADGYTDVNSTPVSVRSTPSLQHATLLLTDHASMGTFKPRNGFDRLCSLVAICRTWGDCYGYTQLAGGYADIMLDEIMSPWDLLALIPVVEGAGGVITSWEGGDPLSSNSIVAATPSLHEEVIRILNS